MCLFLLFFLFIIENKIIEHNSKDDDIDFAWTLVAISLYNDHMKFDWLFQAELVFIHFLFQMPNDTEMTNKSPTCYWFVNMKLFYYLCFIFSSGGERDLSKVEVQCYLCLRFCHHDCISIPTG